MSDETGRPSDDAAVTDHDRQSDVTAAEVAAYAFCAKAWHLERVLGVRASAAAGRARAAGVVRHRRHGRRVEVFRWRARLVWAAGVCLLLAALLVAVAILARGR